MDKIKIDALEISKVVVKKVVGTLSVRGWSQSQIRVDSSIDHGTNLQQEDGTAIVTCKGNCMLKIPRDVDLHIEYVGGNAGIKAIAGQLSVEQVGGQLILRSVGPAVVNEVKSHLLARAVEGDLKVTKVKGAVTVRDIEGDLEVAEVLSNLEVRDVHGDVIISNAAGNANLRLYPEKGQVYKVSAAGDMICKLGSGANAKVRVSSPAKIRVRTASEKILLTGETYKTVLGEGEGQVDLDAAGNIELTCETPEDLDIDMSFMDEFGVLSEEYLASIMESVEAHLDVLPDQLLATTGLVKDETIQRKAEAAARRAERKMAAAKRRIELKMTEAQRKAERQARAAARRAARTGKSYSWNIGKQTRSDPVSEEERRMILKMVEEKKISVEQAETLLASLEGRNVMSEVPEPPTSPDEVETT